MQTLFLSSIAIYGYASILIANFVSLTAAVDTTGGDEWIPASAGAGEEQHAISAGIANIGNNSSPVVVPTTTVDALSSNLEIFGQAAVHSDYPRTKTHSVGQQEQFLPDISDDIDSFDDSLPLPVDKDFTKCHHRKELLSNYSNASSAFIECAVLNAKPISYCGNCVFKYELAKKAWNDIYSSTDCKEDILVSDKLQIVSQTQKFLVELWRLGSCENCYDGKHNFNPYNWTKDFIQKNNDTMTCFLNNGGSSDMPIPEGKNQSLCSNCSEEYKKLNEFYSGLKVDQLCMDIKDQMNRTRILWRDSHCGHHDKEFIATIALSIFICILPFFFYLTAMIHGTKKQQRLVEKSNKSYRRGLSASARLYAGTTESLR